MKKIVAIACLLSVIPLAAVAREKEANTPSGRAEMVFAAMPLDQAVAKVSSACMDRGWMVTNQISNQVVCEVPMGAWQSALTQLAIGNSYSTPPKQFVRVSLAQMGEHTRAQTQVWAETQMAFGQMQHHQYQDDNTYNNMLTFLGEAGAQLPIGTTFTAHAYLGIDGEAKTWPNGRRSQYGQTLKRVMEGAPAHAMGVRTGDVLTKVNNRTFRDEAGLAALLNRQRIGQPITVTVMRDSEELTFNGTAKGRPAITMLVRPADVPEGQRPLAMQIAAAHLGGIEGAREAAGIAQVVEKPETDLERMRREAAEAQARLAAAEAEAAKAQTSAQGDLVTPTDPAHD